jgi:rubredoxin
MAISEGDDEAVARRCAACGGREARLYDEASDSGDIQAGSRYAKVEWRCPVCRVVRVELSTSTWVSVSASAVEGDDEQLHS